MIKALDGKRIPIRELRDDVPAELEQIVDRMMQRTPERRYQSVEEILQDIQKVSILIHAVTQA
jgi:serine/threonine protein kinase